MHPNPTLVDSSPITSSPSSVTQELLKIADLGNDDRNISTAAAAAPLNSEVSSLANERPLAEIVSEKFLPFDATRYIVRPFNVVSERNMTINEEYTTMLLDAVLETHAWASARFEHKYQLETRNLEERHKKILQTEKEQEKVRECLDDFVTKMKRALAALTGVDVLMPGTR